MTIIKQRLLFGSILLIGLGSYLPVYTKIYRSFTQSSPENIRSDFSHCQDHSILMRSRFNRTNHHSDRHPASQIGITISPNGRHIYKLTEHGIQVTNRKNGKQQYFQLPIQFPKLSWGIDLAYDSQRDLISLVSLGGEGFFYRFDAKKRRWLDVRSLNNIDLQSLTYDQTTDRYLAWAEGNLVFISATGEVLSQELVIDQLEGFTQLYNPDNEMIPVVEIVANGKNITLIIYHRNSIQGIWYYNLDSKISQLAYKDLTNCNATNY